jgi:hypothetical protein
MGRYAPVDPAMFRSKSCEEPPPSCIGSKDKEYNTTKYNYCNWRAITDQVRNYVINAKNGKSPQAEGDFRTA